MPAIEQSSSKSATAVPTGVALPSRLELGFTLDGGLTRMVPLRQEPPWRAIRSFRNARRQAVIHLHNVSGGILPGDSLSLTLQAGPATRVQVTSVGATRIYRHRPDRCGSQLATCIRVDDGAVLEYLPDTIIPFSGSRCSQSTSVSLGQNAGFIWWETLAAGRVASREEFGFDFFHSDCVIQSETRPLAMERYSLVPAELNPRSVARFGKFNYTATLYICHTGVGQSVWPDLESRISTLALARTSETERWGASTLAAGGLVIRGLALEAHQITTALYAFWDFAKKDLWGEPALPPRKIN